MLHGPLKHSIAKVVEIIENSRLTSTEKVIPRAIESRPNLYVNFTEQTIPGMAPGDTGIGLRSRSPFVIDHHEKFHELMRYTYAAILVVAHGKFW